MYMVCQYKRVVQDTECETVVLFKTKSDRMIYIAVAHYTEIDAIVVSDTESEVKTNSTENTHTHTHTHKNKHFDNRNYVCVYI